jgi:hypothetical protein
MSKFESDCPFSSDSDGQSGGPYHRALPYGIDVVPISHSRAELPVPGPTSLLGVVGASESGTCNLVSRKFLPPTLSSSNISR